MTALHIAALYGLKNFVNFLATDYETVNIKDLKGRIPLHYCAGESVISVYFLILVHPWKTQQLQSCKIFTAEKSEISD